MEKIKKLKSLLKHNNIDGYIIPKNNELLKIIDDNIELIENIKNINFNFSEEINKINSICEKLV